ncbi:hypothetical protein BANRA_05711 [Klebsiella pneumoniae]|nr:hypothetical protein BANRA_05711 [Klebsiella pneumoniae]
MEAIITDKALKGKNFAVIIDEAHNSQTGSTAAKLQAALGMSGQGKMSTMTVDELLEQLQKSRARPDNISYFAFTGTPKHSFDISTKALCAYKTAFNLSKQLEDSSGWRQGRQTRRTVDVIASHQCDPEGTVYR